MPTVRTFRVIPNLPDRLVARWESSPETSGGRGRRTRPTCSAAWIPTTGRRTRHNPVDMLGTLAQDRLEDLAADEVFLSNMDRVLAELNNYLSRRTWFERAHGDSDGY